MSWKIDKGHVIMHTLIARQLRERVDIMVEISPHYPPLHFPTNRAESTLIIVKPWAFNSRVELSPLFTRTYSLTSTFPPPRPRVFHVARQGERSWRILTSDPLERLETERSATLEFIRRVYEVTTRRNIRNGGSVARL